MLLCKQPHGSHDHPSSCFSGFLSHSSWAQKTWRHPPTLSVFANFQPCLPLFYPLTSTTWGCLRTFALTFPSAGKLSPDGNKSSLPSSAGVSSRVSLLAHFNMKSHSLPKLQKHPLIRFLQNIYHLKFVLFARLLFFLFDPEPHYVALSVLAYTT